VTVPEVPIVQKVVQSDPSPPKEDIAITEPVDAPRASLDALDEAFFQQAEAMEEEARAKMESFPPVAEDLSAQAKVQPPSPAVLARRTKFRKLVAAVVAAGALFVVGGIGKSLLSRSAVAAEPATHTAAVAAEGPAAAPLAEPAAAPIAEPVAVPVAVPEPKATAEPVAIAAPEPVAAQATAEAQEKAAGGVENPRAEALKLLNRGKLKEAIPMASAAIQQEPDHALGYLYLGAALQDSGKHRDAVAAYSDCVRNAKKGPVWECRAMGGRP
jgi:tetratricopeptide (TPR) repeat protein